MRGDSRSASSPPPPLKGRRILFGGRRAFGCACSKTESERRRQRGGGPASSLNPRPWAAGVLVSDHLPGLPPPRASAFSGAGSRQRAEGSLTALPRHWMVLSSTCLCGSPRAKVPQRGFLLVCGPERGAARDVTTARDIPGLPAASVACGEPLSPGSRAEGPQLGAVFLSWCVASLT